MSGLDMSDAVEQKVFLHWTCPGFDLCSSTYLRKALVGEGAGAVWRLSHYLGVKSAPQSLPTFPPGDSQSSGGRVN